MVAGPFQSDQCDFECFEAVDAAKQVAAEPEASPSRALHFGGYSYHLGDQTVYHTANRSVGYNCCTETAAEPIQLLIQLLYASEATDKAVEAVEAAAGEAAEYG